MKIQLLLWSLVLMSSGLKADPSPADGQFAVLKPRLACEVKVPEGRSHSQVYFSQDCQTAYVLPSLNMPKTVLSPLLLADPKICERFATTYNAISGLEPKIKQLYNYREKLEAQLEGATDEASIRVLKDKLEYFTRQIEALEKKKDSALAPFYNTPALRAQIRVESDIMDEVRAFHLANQNQVSVEGKVFPTRFVPALIKTSVLAISPKDDKDSFAKSTLKVSFPGVPYVPTGSEQNQYHKDAVLLHMNGSMSGIVDLSAVTYCANLIKNRNSVESLNTALLKAFDSAVAINMDYQVAVQAGVRLHMSSDINTIDFLSNVQSRITNTAFTRDEFLGQLISGETLNSLEIQIDDKGLEFDLSKVLFGNDEDENEEETGPLAHLIGKFISDYLDQVESKLTKLGLLEKISEQRAKEIAAGTSTELTGYSTICKTTSKYYGLKKNKTCHTTPVYVQVNHAGISNLIKRNADTSRMRNEITFESNQTTTVRHTSTFSMK